MSFKSFLPEKYANTHENIFFRKINLELHEKFSKVDGPHVLIGNVSVGGHQLDALFIKRGAIIVIDFKDYSGTLEFSENGPWKITPDKGRFLFVAGGGGSRNPYQQVNAYRFSLLQFLSDKENDILDQNHTNLSWGHINSLVLFHRTIFFDHSSIPSKIQRYFHVTDNTNFLNRLDDIYSDKLNLSDLEINNILNVLTLTAETQYDESRLDETTIPDLIIDHNKMSKINQLIPDKLDNPLKNILSFYNTMVALERLKSASVTNVLHYKIIWNDVNFSSFNLDLAQNQSFLNIFLTNKRERFPLNLFVSLNVVMNETEIPLFYTVVLTNEVQNINDIEINFNSFEIFGSILSDLELQEDLIEELSHKVNSGETINEKLKIVQDILDTEIILSDSISLGLSDESKFTLQLQSEFNNWYRNKAPLPTEGTVLHSYLTTEKAHPISIGKISDYVQLTSLNRSQKEAIKIAFTQPLSVITGPPGTGKSQVVINILANALVNNQTVLFASKNNKAVDNVYQRINNILDTDYFLRLGNKEANDDTVQVLDKYINLISSKKYENSVLEDSIVLNQHRSFVTEQNSLKKEIETIPKLKASIERYQNEESSLSTTLGKWNESLSKEHRDLYLDKALEYLANISSINECLSIINNSTGFFGSLSLYFGNKKKLQTFVKGINNKLPKELQNYINKQSPYFSPDQKYLHSFGKNLKLIKSESLIQEEIKAKNNDFTTQLETCINAMKASTYEYTRLLQLKDKYLKRIDELEEKIIQSSKQVAQLAIQDKLREASTYTISRYSSYLLNGIPWKHEEVQDFNIVSQTFLRYFKIISISNLSIKKAFLQTQGLFDLLIIDEASQSDIASALPLIYRAKRVVILGDPLQLPHITSIKTQEQDYIANQLGISVIDHNYIKDSLFGKSYNVSNKNNYLSSFLNEHYRCHPEIIEFSNAHFYQPKAGQNLLVKTKSSAFTIGQPGMNWIAINGTVEENRNVNLLEIEKCLQLAEELQKQFPTATIGVITPFTDQKKELQRAFKKIKSDKIVVDTVHRFQGDEKDIIIFSLVVSTNGRETLHRFINYYSSYILNVGITRAKSALYIIGNKQYCKELVDERGKTLLSRLAYYSDTVNQN